MKSLLDIFAALPGLWKHRYLGLVTTVVCAVFGSMVVALIPSKYEASARAYVDTQSILKPLMEGMAVQPNVEQQLRMMARALLSGPNLQEVALQSGLVKEQDGLEVREQLVGRLAADVKFKPDGRSDFFSLIYRNESPEIALGIVDGLLAMFVSTIQGDQKRDNKQALVFLDGEIATYKVRLEEVEKALKEFKIENLEVMPDMAGDYFAKTADVQKEYETSLLQLRQAVNSAESLRAQLNGVPRGHVAPKFGPQGERDPESDLEKRLADANRRLDDLATKYTAQHPDYKNTARVIRGLQRQVDRERSLKVAAESPDSASSLIPNKLYQELSLAIADADSKVASLRAKVGDASRRMKRTRELAKSVPTVEAEFLQLNRDYEVNKKNYEKLLARRDSALLSGSLDASSGAGDFRIVDPPTVSSRPVSPKRPILMTAVLLTSVMAGLAMAYLRHQSNPSYYDIRGLRDHTNFPVLGEVGLVRNTSTRFGVLMSTLFFWFLVLLFLALVSGVVAYQTFGHLLKEEDVPEIFRPMHQAQFNQRLPSSSETHISN